MTTHSTEMHWIHLLQTALAKNPAPTSKWPTLATQGANAPTLRIIAYRALVSSHTDLISTNDSPPPSILHALIYTTDVRSAKTAQLTKNSAAELCWYFEETREQLRMEGRALLVFPPGDPRQKELVKGVEWEKLRKHHFHALSPKARAQFIFPPPGSPLQTASLPHTTQIPDDADAQLVSAALANFALLVFEVAKVDRLDLKPQPNEREVWTPDAGSDGRAWSVQRVNP
ncbi:hypothetical protein HDU87_006758 [Geranomyces variabilis]|uniref:Pyridoxamine 5'-phosphate oxidase Alr4036 family FMN-binding domain-containing protein n=1 Tax=Geranomyces variabilis TaxID=109894 RepID=A0AAD5TPS8_9FUNG|nr:hypothetical protein HDU87_006758 [Geranomyces variabilis]